MFKSYSPSDGLVSCPWPHDVYLVIYAWWYPMAGDWAIFSSGLSPLVITRGYKKTEILWRGAPTGFRKLLKYVFYSKFKYTIYTRENTQVEWRKTPNLWPFFPRIRILQSVKGRWKSNRPRSIVLFILGEKRVSGTPPLNTILPGQQCPHHGIWDGYCL